MLLVHKGHASARRFFTPANASSYDKVVRLATFGQDSAWKRRIVDAAGDVNGNKKVVGRGSTRGASVLELACGTGILSSMLRAEEWVGSVAGLDLTFDYLLGARRKMSAAAREGAVSVSASTAVVAMPLAQGTAELLPYRSEAFDAVVSSYLAKYVDVRMVARESWRVLKPGGVAVMHDFTYPRSGAMRALWNSYFCLLRLAGAAVVSWKTVFGELDGVIRDSAWVVDTHGAMRDAGFVDIKCESYTLGTAATVYGRKAGSA